MGAVDERDFWVLRGPAPDYGAGGKGSAVEFLGGVHRDFLVAAGNKLLVLLILVGFVHLFNIGHRLPPRAFPQKFGCLKTTSKRPLSHG